MYSGLRLMPGARPDITTPSQPAGRAGSGSCRRAGKSPFALLLLFAKDRSQKAAQWNLELEKTTQNVVHFCNGQCVGPRWLGCRRLRWSVKNVIMAAAAANSASARLSGLKYLVRHQQALADDLQHRLDRMANTPSTYDASRNRPTLQQSTAGFGGAEGLSSAEAHLQSALSELVACALALNEAAPATAGDADFLDAAAAADDLLGRIAGALSACTSLAQCGSLAEAANAARRARERRSMLSREKLVGKLSAAEAQARDASADAQRLLAENTALKASVRLLKEQARQAERRREESEAAAAAREKRLRTDLTAARRATSGAGAPRQQHQPPQQRHGHGPPPPAGSQQQQHAQELTSLLELQAQHMSPQPYLTWQEAPPAGVPWQGGESAEGAVPLYGDLISPRGESSNRAAITPGDTIAASSSGTPRAGAAVGAATDSGSAKLKPKVAKQMLHSANLWPPA